MNERIYANVNCMHNQKLLTHSIKKEEECSHFERTLYDLGTDSQFLTRLHKKNLNILFYLNERVKPVESIRNEINFAMTSHKKAYI